ncbi:MAG: hypothetical protein KDD68_05955, partial [Bdellovibrionales bacterium]|nr:hypothetical protein [Bdellovibrionales bacterium]
SNFDDKNGKRVLRSFGYDKKLMKKFTEALLDELGTYTPENVSDQVGKMLSKMKIRGDKYALGQFYGIAGGAGTLIRIDEDNYYYNIGYFAPEVRSGRSYGATPHHNANDASHLMYLGELEKFLKYRNDYRQFYTAILEFLTDTDVSVYQNPTFNEYGEALLTDYITVYTAELRRHLMRKLSPYSAPWGNDMTEATFLSLFNVKSGLMMLEGELTKASIKNHWALSPTGSGRSGFGINRKDRRRLQAMISNYFRYHDDASKREIVKKIDKLVGKRRDGDCYRALMQYFNNEINLLNPFRVESIENEIVTAFADFLMAVYDETDEIVESLSEAH